MINTIKEKYDTLAIFPYGSNVYKNKIPEDYDFIIVSEKPYFQESFILNNTKFEITNHYKEDFSRLLDSHEISILECCFIDHKNKYISDDIIKKINDFSIDKLKLRESISSKSSNSYVKAKKKIEIGEDFNLNVSLKSLWHSIRMIEFGIQFANNGVIEPEKSNYLYDEILKDYLIFNNDWSKLHSKYRPIYNSISTEFKKICPKVNSLKP